LKLLQSIKKQLDLALKLIGTSNKKDELADEAKKLRNDFKHYLRRMWSFK
jgi:hypothetical protein